jgi:hypothetical protein
VGTMTPAPTRSYVDGAAINDSATLLTWLQQTKGTPLRLPVRVEFDDQYRLAVARAEVGSLPLKLDDTAMSVPVLDQLRTLCPVNEPGCVVWLEGTWGAVLEVGGMPALSMPGVSGPAMPGPGLSGPGLSVPGFPAPAAGPKRHDFSVRRVGGLVDGTASHAQAATGS